MAGRSTLARGADGTGRNARALAVLAACVGIGACGAGAATSADPPARSVRVDRFHERAAWQLIRRQVRVGQRPAGSPQLRRLAVTLRRLLPAGRFEPIPGQPGLRNIVGRLPGRRPAVVIAAHYDTLVKPPGFVGANNGAAGTAIVVQLARDLRHVRRPRHAPELRFVLFDGEEPAAGLPEDSPNFYQEGLRGSRAYVAAHVRAVGQMVLLDYVAGRGLRLPREGTSTPWLWERIRAAGRAVGVGAIFPNAVQVGITDDHTPFLLAGIPAVDLIDWHYPGHSLKDGLDKLSLASVDAVGETLVRFALTARLTGPGP